MIKNVVFDFNGTLIDDRALCFNLLNEMLISKGHPSVTMERYLEIFTFPVYDYYLKAGFRFDEEVDDNFDELAEVFVKEYVNRFSKEVHLFPDVKEILAKIHGKTRIFVLSATREDLLINQLKIMGIYDSLDHAIGIKDIFAASKIEEAKKYFSSSNLNLNETLFVGDTLHDNEVARELGGTSLLVARGHQNKIRLLEGKPDYVSDDFSIIPELINDKQ
ncbi:MAG: HAD hydrolase-like protein [Bacilli bacterium]|nr:HAD hydrolase-like protein [Bacilli bacterium]